MAGIKVMDNTQIINQVKLLVDRADASLNIAQCPGTQLIQSQTQNPHLTGSWKQRSIKQPD